MSEYNSLFVKRSLLQVEHAGLRQHMERLNTQIPDVTLQWRRLGEVSVMLVQSGEYEALTQVPRSRLRTRPVRQVVKDLNDTILQGRERTLLPLQATKFLAHNTAEYVHVGFAINPDELVGERQEITAQLDRMNRAPGDWRHQFHPFLSIATLNRLSATDEVRDAFQTIMPETVTLYGAKAQAG